MADGHMESLVLLSESELAHFAITRQLLDRNLFQKLWILHGLTAIETTQLDFCLAKLSQEQSQAAKVEL